MQSLPDCRLVELACSGEQAAFGELYSRYFDRISRFAARFTCEGDAAADIAQETFLKAMNALEKLQDGKRFKTWLFSIARNTALNHIARRRRECPLTAVGEDGDERDLEVVDPCRFSDPEETAFASCAAALVWQAAACLDARQRRILHLQLREGLDCKEIAESLGVTLNHAYVMLNRLQEAVRSSVGAIVMLQCDGGRCEDLEFELGPRNLHRVSPEARRVIQRHMERCEACSRQRDGRIAEMLHGDATVSAPSPRGRSSGRPMLAAA